MTTPERAGSVLADPAVPREQSRCGKACGNEPMHNEPHLPGEFDGPFTDTRIKINPVEKELWAAALDSGEHKQAVGVLFNGKGYCCLGLYAKVKGCQFSLGTVMSEDDDGNDIEIEADAYTVSMPGNDTDVNASELLEQNFADTAGITAEHQALLSHLNDGGTIAFAKSSPMYDLCKKLGFEQIPSMHSKDITQFVLPKHTFAEISKIIRENF